MNAVRGTAEKPRFRKGSDIQRILTRYFILVSLLMLLAISVIFSVMQYRALRQDTMHNLQHTAASLGESVDQQIEQMNRVSLSAISSSAMHTAFRRYMSEEMPAYQKNLLRQELAGALTSAKGFDFSIRQLNLYSPLEGGYGVGGYNGDLPDSCRDHSWYAGTMEAGGKLFMPFPETDPFLSHSSGMNEDVLYMSVCRLFYDSYHAPIGFVEVKKFYTDVFHTALMPEISLPVSVTIYNREGELLFPLFLSDGKAEGNDPGFFAGWEEGDSDRVNSLTGKKEYVSYSLSPGQHLLVAVSIAHREFLSPVYRSLLGILAVLLIMLTICIPLSWLVSRRISTPIRQIYHFLSDPGRDRFAPLEMEETGIRELDKLHNSLNESIRLQKTATDTMMKLKEQELQTQMLALQSQMNPHFLFNSLSTIAEMAQEGLNESAAGMCRDITEIFRYISSNREQRICLEEEMELCDMYLNCMKTRFGEDLQYCFAVEDEMLDFMIPKLCVQLLVENAIKSATTQSPPWQIRVTGLIRDDHWYLTVKDNGPGFDPEVESHLRQEMRKILDEGILPSLKIEGMGILNIFIRLYLLDGIPFIFDFGNAPDGGAFVTVGGSCHRDEVSEGPSP